MSINNEVGRDSIDTYLGRYMKSYAAQYPLPASGKAELLEKAAASPLTTRSNGICGLVLIILRRSLRALSYLMSDQPELDPLPGRMAMVFVNGVSFT